jgi:hypothetical protein
MAEKIKVAIRDIKKLILGNQSDCECCFCGYPMGCGDTAYEYAEEVFCSKTCALKANEGQEV